MQKITIMFALYDEKTIDKLGSLAGRGFGVDAYGKATKSQLWRTVFTAGVEALLAREGIADAQPE